MLPWQLTRQQQVARQQQQQRAALLRVVTLRQVAMLLARQLLPWRLNES